jgi:Family of unknown function (DUF5361)
VFVRYLDADSSLVRVMYPDRAGWSRGNMLLAEMVDSLHWLVWAKTKAGQRGRDRPPLVPRPGVGPQRRTGSAPKAAPLSVVKERLAARRRRPPDPEAQRTAKLAGLFGGR